MNLPFVSRERLTEAQAQNAELKAEVKALREKNEYLVNQIVWRQSSIALDPSLLPEHYRPKTVTPVNTPQGNALNDPPAKQTISGSGPSRMRQTIREKEKQLEADFISKTVGVSVPVTMTAEDLKARDGLLNKLNDAANEGMKAAQEA